MICNNILETVGNTPIVRTDKIFKGLNIFLKLEYFNLSNSIKDRAAINIIENAEKNGFLNSDSTIIESTSGNFGISLAYIAAIKGYKVIIVTDPKISKMTLGIIKTLGAEIEEVTESDSSGNYQMNRIKKVKQLLKTIPNSFWTNQYDNENNPLSYELAAKEIIKDMPDLDTLIASVSTGGHLCGLSTNLKKYIPNLKTIAVDAQGSAIFTETFKPYKINGIGLKWKTKNINMSTINEVNIISDNDAISACNKLVKEEGLLIGGSGGAVVASCFKNAIKSNSTKTILGIIPDGGTNYLKTIFNDDWRIKNNIVVNDSIFSR